MYILKLQPHTGTPGFLVMINNLSDCSKVQEVQYSLLLFYFVKFNHVVYFLGITVLTIICSVKSGRS